MSKFKSMKAYVLETKNGNILTGTVRTRKGTLEGMLSGTSYKAMDYRREGCKVIEIIINRSKNKWDHDDITHWQEITPPRESVSKNNKSETQKD